LRFSDELSFVVCDGNVVEMDLSDDSRHRWVLRNADFVECGDHAAAAIGMKTVQSSLGAMFEESVPPVDSVSIDDDLELFSGAFHEFGPHGGAFLRIDFDFDLPGGYVRSESLGQIAPEACDQ